MTMLLGLLAQAQAKALAIPATAEGNTWWESALVQFPVAALVVFVVFFFMRAIKSKDESHQDQIKDITASDRKDRGEQQRVMVETFKGMQEHQAESQKASMEIFKTAQLEATKQVSVIQTQVIDALDRSTHALDRSTESFGRFNATLEFRAVAKEDDPEPSTTKSKTKTRKK